METDQVKITKLQKLKAEVQTNYTTVTFTTPDDLAHKAAQAIQNWTRENAASWQAMEHAAQPLSEREKELIEELHHSDERLVEQAIRKLANLKSRAALEHFLALLRRSDISRNVKKSILDVLNEFKDNDRALDVLIAAMNDADSDVRSRAVLHIGERGVLGGFLTVASVASLERLASDADDLVREETAHALGKIGNRYHNFNKQCIVILTQLTKDPVLYVKDRAKSSLKLCRQRP
jgi:HEAT repeat protein